MKNKNLQSSAGGFTIFLAAFQNFQKDAPVRLFENFERLAKKIVKPPARKKQKAYTELLTELL